MHDLTTCDRNYHHLRADLIELQQWADVQLTAGQDRRYIAEHMTDVIDALLSGETVPPRPF